MKELLLLTVCCLLLLGHSEAQAPANDQPCNAVALTVENLGCEPTITYSYTSATHSAAYGNTYCYQQPNRDVWYRFTVPASGEATVAIATAGQNEMALEVLTGTSCNGPLSITNPNTQGFTCLYIRSNIPAESRTFKNLSPGSTVYLRLYRLDDIQAANGAIKICVSDPTRLSDEPCDAGFFPIADADPLGQNCEPNQTIFFTGATLTPSIPNPECLFPGYFPLVRDIWFKVRVPATGKVNLGIKADGPYVFQSWNIQTFTANACTGPFVSLGCTSWDGASGAPLKSFATYTNLTPNSIIYCRLVANSSVAQPDGQVKICVSSFNTTPPINNSTTVGIGIDTPFAKLDVVGTGIYRDKLTAGRDLEVRGNLILQGNLISRFSRDGGIKTSGGMTIEGGLITSGGLTADNLSSGGLTVDSIVLRNRFGNRISLWGGMGNSAHYGMGVQSGLLQLYVPSGNEALAIGSGSSQSFVEAMRVRGPHIGIGNTTPNAPLQFASDTRNRKIVLFEFVNNDHQFYGFGINAGVLRYQTATSQDDHVFYSGQSTSTSRELIRIKGNGLVGFGVSDPVYRLDLDNRIRIRSGGNNANSAGIWLNRNDNSSLSAFVGMNENNVGFYGIPGGWGLEMNTTNGFVGIGNSSPQVALHFANTLGKKISLYRSPFGDAGFGVFGNELRMHSDYNGADITFGYDDFTNGFTERFRIRANGNANLAGTLTQNSDVRLKKNISPISNATTLLEQIHGYRYHWIDPNQESDVQVGLLAQEVQTVLPELVKQQSNGLLSVNYTGMIPLLLESLHEAHQKINAQQQQIDTLLRTIKQPPHTSE